VPDRGAAALVHGVPVAVFLLRSGELFAVDNIDPCSGANVMSRGLVGDSAGVPTVASPMYKQRFDLRNGRCLDEPDRALGVHHARIVDDVIEVALGASGGSS
jgi:nitrite reductase (NADH) small subunit